MKGREMTSARRWVFVALIGMAAGAYGQGDGGKVEIRQWAIPGEYEATMEMVMDQAMTVDGQVQPKQRMEQMLVTKVRVGEAEPEGDRQIEMRFDRIKQVVKRGAQTLSYDSAGDQAKQNEELARAYRPLLGIKMSIVVGPDGKVKEVTGLEEFWKKLAEENPRVAETLKDMQKQMGDQVVKELISKGRDLMPAGGAAVGQSWKNDKTVGVPFLGEVKLVQDCKLTKVEKTQDGRMAVIDYKGKMTLPKDAKVQVGMVSLEFTAFAMNQEGQVLYNIDTGMSDASLTQEAKMEMTGKDERGKAIEMTLKQEGTVKVSTRKAGAATAPATQPETKPAS